MNYTLAGHLANREAFYATGGFGFAVEKDHQRLVQPTPAEIKEIGEIRLAQLGVGENDSEVKADAK